MTTSRPAPVLPASLRGGPTTTHILPPLSMLGEKRLTSAPVGGIRVLVTPSPPDVVLLLPPKLCEKSEVRLMLTSAGIARGEELDSGEELCSMIVVIGPASHLMATHTDARRPVL